MRDNKLILVFNVVWKKIVAIQLIGYILTIVFSPITICIFEKKSLDGSRWMTF